MPGLRRNPLLVDRRAQEEREKPDQEQPGEDQGLRELDCIAQPPDVRAEDAEVEEQGGALGKRNA